MPLMLLLSGGIVVLLVAMFVIFHIVDTLVSGIFGLSCYLTPCDITGIVTLYKTLVLLLSFSSTGILAYFSAAALTRSITVEEVGASKDSIS
jgi:hypothetical protein